MRNRQKVLETIVFDSMFVPMIKVKYILGTMAAAAVLGLASCASTADTPSCCGTDGSCCKSKTCGKGGSCCGTCSADKSSK